MEHKIKTNSSKKNHSELSPFIKKLSNNGIKYFELLNEGNASKMRSGFVTLKPGESIGEHSTGNYEEMLIILSGEGEIEAEGIGLKKIKAGDIAYNPPETKHNVINNGSKSMEYIFVVSIA